MAYKKLKYWFDEELAILLYNKLARVTPLVKKTNFVTYITSAVEGLELKDRIAVFADAFHNDLGQDYLSVIKILNQIVGPENPQGIDMFKEFYWLMPHANYIERYGLDHLEASIESMLLVTKRNTAEYCIRPYIERFSDKMYEYTKSWVEDKNQHVRRLASEGFRPRLPWAKKLTLTEKQINLNLEILDHLKDDKSKYVQKSVANHMNDLLKEMPSQSKELLIQWSKKPSESRKWVLKQALRNEIKKESKWAMDIAHAL